MTRDDHRAKCIEAMARAAYHAMTLRMVYRHGANLNLDLFDSQPNTLKEDWIASQTAAFDSLHGVAFVVPIEAAEEMKTLWRVNPQSRGDTYAEFLAVCHAGDLTNQPEEKK